MSTATENRKILMEFAASCRSFMKPEVAVICPFCHGQYCAGKDLVDDEYMVMHSVPVCNEFADNEIDEFMSMARLKLTN